MIKSNPIHAKWAAHKLENNNTKEVLPEPHFRLPSLGIPQRD